MALVAPRGMGAAERRLRGGSRRFPERAPPHLPGFRANRGGPRHRPPQPSRGHLPRCRSAPSPQDVTPTASIAAPERSTALRAPPASREGADDEPGPHRERPAGASRERAFEHVRGPERVRRAGRRGERPRCLTSGARSSRPPVGPRRRARFGSRARRASRGMHRPGADHEDASCPRTDSTRDSRQNASAPPAAWAPGGAASSVAGAGRRADACPSGPYFSPSCVRISGFSSSIARTWWHASQSAETVVPSFASRFPLWQRKQPGKSSCPMLFGW